MSKLLASAIIFISVLSTVSMAATVVMTPDSWEKAIWQQVSIDVANSGNYEITQFELFVPTEGGTPVFYIGDITRPEGWTYSVSSAKVTWFAKGTGIKGGESLNLFAIMAQPTKQRGSYQWTWRATDSNSATTTGTIYTSVGQTPLAGFKITGVPASTIAGSSFKMIVTAYGSDGKPKTDYTGTVSFASSANASLPSAYTFQPSDSGAKEFIIKYYTASNQAITVTDSSSKIASTSIMTNVKPSQADGIMIVPQVQEASIGEKVKFAVLALDKYNNSFDITDKAKFQPNEGGTWSANTFIVQKSGEWVLIAKYNSFADGAILKATQTIEPPAVSKESASIAASGPIEMLAGSNKTAVVTVKNTGDYIRSVRIVVEGVPSGWTSVQPSDSAIAAGGSKDFLVIFSVPENESAARTVTFQAVSGSNVLDSKSANLVVSGGPTGAFLNSKNFLQLGIVMIAISAVVIIGWEVWFKKKKPVCY